MGWVWRHCTAALAAAILALCLPAAARAQGALAGKPIATCLKPVAPGDDAATLLAHPRGFDCRSDQRRFGPGDFWVATPPVRLTAEWPPRLRAVSLWQRHATLWARYADGAVVRLDGDGRELSRRLQLGAIVEWKLPKHAVPVTRLLWRIDGAANMRGVLVGVRSATPTQSANANLIMAALYAGFGGLCLSLLIYNVALYGALRHRFQLAYCVMVAALLVYAVSSSGALAWLLPDIANNDRLRINYVALALAAAAALNFARAFFENHVFTGRLARATTAVTGLLIGSAVLFAALAPWQARLLDRLYAVSFALLIGLVPAILLRAWRAGSGYLWLFGLAWSLPVTLAAVRIASGIGLIGWSFWIDNSTLFAMAAEALTSSLAIAYRIRLLSRERDEAREQEMAARILADTDPLTGLLNRRAFLGQAIGRPGEQCLLLLDIDHFKRVNDTIGHDGGDEVLRLVARALRQAMPPGALVARVGGEEFAAVCDAATAPAPGDVLDRLRAERMPFDMSVTSSLGVCRGALTQEADWKRLYRRADQALFAAKAAGRDRARDAAQLAA